MPGNENEIIGFVRAGGPRRGSEVIRAIDADPIDIWKTCFTSPELHVRSVGSRYMRLDRHVDGFARLSPSILREFLTYSVIFTQDAEAAANERCRALLDHIHEISTRKFDLSRRMVLEIIGEFDPGHHFDDALCFIIAGDIVYNMAHDVPRPEHSTGKLVKGSDIDLVVVVPDDLPDAEIERLDTIVYARKYRMLKDPGINEEVDYKIKKMGRIREQCAFDTFPFMVAIKILDEGRLLGGSEDIYRAVKSMLDEHDLPRRLKELEKNAISFRRRAEELILSDSIDEKMIKDMHLFYSTEEYEEFE
jgi:hypothetical protein